MNRFRILAVVLALGATCWGVFCVPVTVAVPLLGLLFLPGYVLTVGYIAMACGTLSADRRRLVWVFSTFVQGAWLSLALVGVVSDRGFRGDVFFVIAFTWWCFATLASFYGFVAEPERRSA